MIPFKVGQKVRIVRGSIDNSVKIIKSCSWRPNQIEPDPIPMKEHWKGKVNKNTGIKEPDFAPLLMPCPSYTLENINGSWYHF